MSDAAQPEHNAPSTPQTGAGTQQGGESSAKRRTRNAWIEFCRTERPKLKAIGIVSLVDIQRELSRLYAALTDGEKESLKASPIASPSAALTMPPAPVVTASKSPMFVFGAKTSPTSSATPTVSPTHVLKLFGTVPPAAPAPAVLTPVRATSVRSRMAASAPPDVASAIAAAAAAASAASATETNVVPLSMPVEASAGRKRVARGSPVRNPLVASFDSSVAPTSMPVFNFKAGNFTDWPVYLAAEFLTSLRLCDILALCEVSKGVRAKFRTVVSAIVLIQQVLKDQHVCVVHLPVESLDSPDVAWSKLRSVMQIVWTSQMPSDSQCDENAPCIPVSLVPASRTARDLHRKRCCRRFSYATAAQRRELLQRMLGEFGCTLRGDSQLCLGWIDGSKSDVSLAEVCATMQNTKWLMETWDHIVYSNNHLELRALTSDLKFTENIPWHSAAAQARNSISLEFAESDEEDEEDEYEYSYSNRRGRGGGACYNCRQYGHYARDCWY